MSRYGRFETESYAGFPSFNSRTCRSILLREVNVGVDASGRYICAFRVDYPGIWSAWQCRPNAIDSPVFDADLETWL